MIKKILAWITGKSDTAVVAEAAPYKVEAPVAPIAEAVPVAEIIDAEALLSHSALKPANRCGCGRSPTGMCLGFHNLTEEEWQEKTGGKLKTRPVPAGVALAPVIVKQKYKKSELNNMNKKELLECIAKHNIELKGRATKEDLIKMLMRV
jgi:hypothetical protein